jgi:hypothetical protein
MNERMFEVKFEGLSEQAQQLLICFLTTITFGAEEMAIVSDLPAADLKISLEETEKAGFVVVAFPDSVEKQWTLESEFREWLKKKFDL